MKFLITYRNADTNQAAWFPCATEKYSQAIDLFIDFCKLNKIGVVDGSILVISTAN